MGIVDEILKKRGTLEVDQGFHKEYELKFPELDNLVNVLTTEFFLKTVGKIGILYDPDVDGLFSGHILEDFFIRMGKTAVNFINPMKQHGLVDETMEWVEQEQLDWLFVVDAGSGDIENIRRCVEMGVKVVILDHHPYEESELPEGAWIVNVSKYPELPPLSGCGVVYRFVEKVGRQFEMPVEQYETFVGITVMSDMCDMTDLENRYYVSKAYEGYRDNVFLRQFTFYGSHRSFYGWGVSPYLNALIRTGEERRAVEVVSNMNRRAKMNSVPRDVKRVKERQRSMMDELYERGELKKNKSINLHLRHGVDDLRTLNGLVANGLIKEYGRGGLVLAYDKEDKKWKGSFRGLQFGQKELEKWGFWTAGHDKACGVKISNKGLIKFYKKFNYPMEEDLEKADIYVNAGELTAEQWEDIAEFNEYSGVGNPEIIVGYKKGVYEIEDEETEYGVRNLYTGDGEIKDFTSGFSEELFVVPILDRRGYQLIRA